MKKHIIAILIITLTLTMVGLGIWMVVRANKIKPLYKANCEFILSEDTETLVSKMEYAHSLYTNKVLSTETRLDVLKTVVLRLDDFEKDLNSYLTFSRVKASKTKKLSKSYINLSHTRAELIKDYSEYITRMSGNLNADGNALQSLYNEIFGETVSYIRDYNKCFLLTSEHVFNKVYTADTIKQELYTFYSLGVKDLLDNIANNNFESVVLINRLNSAIDLQDNNLVIKQHIDGGEFSIPAIKFKQHFNLSDKTLLINNFETYYNTTINPTSETSNEKLAIYYAKQILEI